MLLEAALHFLSIAIVNAYNISLFQSNFVAEIVWWIYSRKRARKQVVNSDVIGYRLSRSRTEISALNRLGYFGWLPALAVCIYYTVKIF